MSLTNKGYDVLKFIALVLLPAVATGYATIAAIWGLKDVTQVVGTVSAVDTFLGVILHLSSNPDKAPVDGQLVVDSSDPNKTVATLELNTHPANLIDQPAVTLKVTPAKTVPGAPQPAPK